jgi:hypothetical protein
MQSIEIPQPLRFQTSKEGGLQEFLFRTEDGLMFFFHEKKTASDNNT